MSLTLSAPKTGWARLLAKANQLSNRQKASYVRLMLTIIASALVAASRHDPIIEKELAGYPLDFRLRLGVLPDTANRRLGFTLQVKAIDGKLQFVALTDNEAGAARPDLAIHFKHTALAFLVFSFQESTAQSFANDRMVADGDLAYAVRFVRLLNQLEAVILPKSLAIRAIKRYPKLSLSQKLRQARPIYLAVAQQFTHQLVRRP